MAQILHPILDQQCSPEWRPHADGLINDSSSPAKGVGNGVRLHRGDWQQWRAENRVLPRSQGWVRKPTRRSERIVLKTPPSHLPWLQHRNYNDSTAGVRPWPDTLQNPPEKYNLYLSHRSFYKIRQIHRILMHLGKIHRLFAEIRRASRRSLPVVPDVLARRARRPRSGPASRRAPAPARLASSPSTPSICWAKKPKIHTEWMPGWNHLPVRDALYS